jgi:hypothetical protein
MSIMNTQSMRLVAITFSGMCGAVCADRLELNKPKNTTGSSSTEVFVESLV